MTKYIQIPIVDLPPPADCYGEYALVRLACSPEEILNGIKELLLQLGETGGCLELFRPSDVTKDFNALDFFSRERALTRDWGTSTVDLLLGKRSRSPPDGPAAKTPRASPPVASPPVSTSTPPVFKTPKPQVSPPFVAVAAHQLAVTALRSVIKAESSPEKKPSLLPREEVRNEEEVRMNEDEASRTDPVLLIKQERRGDVVIVNEVVEEEKEASITGSTGDESDSQYSFATCSPIGSEVTEEAAEEQLKDDPDPSASVKQLRHSVKDEIVAKKPVDVTPLAPPPNSTATDEHEELAPQETATPAGTMPSEGALADIDASTKEATSTSTTPQLSVPKVEKVPSPTSPSADDGDATARLEPFWNPPGSTATSSASSSNEPIEDPSNEVGEDVIDEPVEKADGVQEEVGEEVVEEPIEEQVQEEAVEDASDDSFAFEIIDNPIEDVGQEEVREEVVHEVVEANEDPEDEEDCRSTATTPGLFVAAEEVESDTRSTATTPGPFVADDNDGNIDDMNDDVQEMHDGGNASASPVTFDDDFPMSDTTTPPHDPSPGSTSPDIIEIAQSVIQVNPQSSVPAPSKPIIHMDTPSPVTPVATSVSGQKMPLKSCLKNSTQSLYVMPMVTVQSESSQSATPPISTAPPTTVSTTPIAPSTPIIPAPLAYSTELPDFLKGQENSAMARSILRARAERAKEKAALAAAAAAAGSSTESPPVKKSRLDDTQDTPKRASAWNEKPLPTIEQINAFLLSRPIIPTPYSLQRREREAAEAREAARHAAAVGRKAENKAEAALLAAALRKKALNFESRSPTTIYTPPPLFKTPPVPPPRTPKLVGLLATRATPLIKTTLAPQTPTTPDTPIETARSCSTDYSPINADPCLTPVLLSSSSSSSPSSEDSPPTSTSPPEKTSPSKVTVTGTARRKQTLVRSPSPDDTVPRVQKKGILKKANDGTKRFGDTYAAVVEMAGNGGSTETETHIRCNVCQQWFSKDDKNSKQKIRYHVLHHCPLKQITWNKGSTVENKAAYKHHERGKITRHQEKVHRLTKDRFQIDSFDNELYTAMHDVYMKKCFPNFDTGKLAIGINLNRPNLIEELHSCSLCKKKAYKSLLAYHIMDKHVEILMYTCDACEFKTVKRRHLVLHQQACHQRPGTMDVVGKKYAFETGAEYLIKAFFPTFVDSEKADPPEVLRMEEVLRPSFNMDAEMRELLANLDGLSNLIQHPLPISEATCMVCAAEPTISKFTDLYDMVMHTKSHIMEKSEFQWQCPEQGCDFRGRYKIHVDQHMMEQHEQSLLPAVNRWHQLVPAYSQLFHRCFPSHMGMWPTGYARIDTRCFQDNHPSDPAQAGLSIPKAPLSEANFSIKCDPAFDAMVNFKSE